ncbi:MAG TPA: hypothetical protein VGG34_12920 [Opitutaceae bacterium]
MPTALGLVVIAALAALPAVWWTLCGERFLSPTYRVDRDVLVVEGWIGIAGIRASGAEFKDGHYRYVVTTSGTSDNEWDESQRTYADIASTVLRNCGVPEDQIITAAPSESQSRRTYTSAVAVFNALARLHIKPTGINVFTFGVHGRRSHLVFQRVFGGECQVGVISWIPAGYVASRWWHSSERSTDMIKETVGYLFELLLDSGRFLDSHSAPTVPAPKVAFSSPEHL